MIKLSNGEQHTFPMKKVKIVLVVAIVLALCALGIKVLADTVYQPSALFDTQLATTIANSTSTTSFTLQNGTDGDGNALTGNMCFTVDGGLSNVEYICGSVSGTVVSNLVRGVSFTDGVTSIASHLQSHRIGADVKITDFPYLSQFARILNGAGTIPNSLLYASHPASSASTTIEDKSYIDAGLLNGGAPALSTVPGIIFAATSTQLIGSIATGTYGANTYYYAVSAGSVASTSRATSIPLTNASGTIDPSFVAGQNYTLNSISSASTTLSTSTTISGQLRNSASSTYSSTSTFTGSIISNGLVSGNSSFLTETDGSVSFNASTTSNTQTSTITLGFQPKVIGINGSFTCGATNGSGNFNSATGGSAMVNASGTAIGGLSYTFAANSAGGGQQVVTGLGSPASGFSCSVNGTVEGQSISIGISNINSTGFTIVATSTNLTGSYTLTPGSVTWYALK